ncbi:xanthine phosphoribosyltransferase [Brevibacillus fulvus]|uniref:Xanthine phosphoribosyltransferase n=1 Tax=Brevibacillus fulvus TaxID=1125967 RepID=A0A938XZT5_9BACL|nr:xanthine phosphoribosyltransferase [Brevibacillus fulvus]MBM7590705.1 xanthine phosphoribosyltransferase [Brevibacillus fulvus]
MKTLQERIQQDGEVLSSQVLKVDAFLNHQVDPVLTMDIGQAFAQRFQGETITKVLTIEASGIHFAMATALALRVPFVYAKKKKAVTQEAVYSVPVHSFTRQETYQISVSQKYLSPDDQILIVDDFLATGAALLGLVELIQQAGARLVGVGAVIEKSFQPGRSLLEQAGVRVESLARIAEMSPGQITFIEEAEETVKEKVTSYVK